MNDTKKRRPGKVRVAVLGGGAGGVTAAFRLSDTEEKRSRFEVTLYQQGFRLGGKGATGRNLAQGARIEEHGLHVWMGFYQHAFALVRDAYEAWEAPHGARYRRIEDVFVPHRRVTLAEEEKGAEDDLFTLDFPSRRGLPWEPDAPMDVRAMAEELSAWAGRSMAMAAERCIRSPGKAGRRAWLLARLAAAVLRGLLIDVLPLGERGFDAIDAYDLRAWLARHGAPPAVAEAPPIRAFYDLAFAYPEGRSGRGRGQVAAGAALRSILRMLFQYRGAPFWTMKLGMGDTVFAPMHDVLERRGVRVALFHRLSRMIVEGGEVRALELVRQARSRGAYRPFIEVHGQPCWPDAPLWEQLEDGDRARDRGTDYESSACTVGDPVRLERGADFDVVILAIPVDAHRRIAAELIASSPAFARMVESSRTVTTAAVQIWLKKPLDELGSNARSTVLTGFRSPFRSMADLADVLSAEDWPADERPRSVLYLCDVWPDPPDPCSPRVEPLRDEVRRSLDSLLSLFPGAARDGGFDANLLAAVGATSTDERIEKQYIRVNADASQRYVLTLPGTTAHRLAPDDSGFDGLYLAGDWTRTSINGGSVEAAVESGDIAADAIVRRYA